MIPFTPTHTLPSYHVTKITRFPPGCRLAKLRETSKYAHKIEVGCQISHCETMTADENLNKHIFIDGGQLWFIGSAETRWGAFSVIQNPNSWGHDMCRTRREENQAYLFSLGYGLLNHDYNGFDDIDYLFKVGIL